MIDRLLEALDIMQHGFIGRSHRGWLKDEMKLRVLPLIENMFNLMRKSNDESGATMRITLRQKKPAIHNQKLSAV